MSLSVSEQGISFALRNSEVLSVDVFFDAQRIWSLDLRDQDLSEDLTFPWPDPVRRYLKGRSTVEIRDSASGNALFRADHSFSQDPIRTEILDDSGNLLAVNKWGRLGKTLDGADPDFQGRILSKTAQVLRHLEELGLRPFLVGGTLLGAVREGHLLPHDDDADIAYLSRHTTPAEVAREGFAVGRALSNLGYNIVRHSATHMQLHFEAAPGTTVDYYVDVFAAFFTDDGFINQPFHVRGKMRPDQMLPFSEVFIDGLGFPAPADTDRWLTINYDANWRTPIPGYQLGTPIATQRRFKNWFGSFHFQRDFWNDQHRADISQAWNTGGRWIEQQQRFFQASTLVDLGCGAGGLTQQLAKAQPSRRTIGLDYSSEALRAATENPLPQNLEFGHINLYRLLSLGLTKQFGISGPFDLTLNHLMEQVGSDARENIWRIIRIALTSGGRAIATVHTCPAEDVSFTDPTGWHLTQGQILHEAAAAGISCAFTSLPEASPTEAQREPVGIIFSIGATPPNSISQGEPLIQRLKRVLKRMTTGPETKQLEALNERIHSLEEEIDELRRDRLRVSELLDLAEQSFTRQTSPGQNTQSGEEEPLS